MTKKAQKVEEKKSEVDFRKLELNKGEIARIIISQTQDGAITTLTKSEGRSMTFIEAIGLMEVAKAEAMYSMRLREEKSPQMDPSLMEEVEVTLDDIDVELDEEGFIEKENIPVGEPIKVTRYAAMMREKRREDYLKAKERNKK